MGKDKRKRGGDWFVKGILTGFNWFKLIQKPTRIKPPSATLLDNIYTNYPITVDACKSGTLTSDISDHFFVFGIFENLIPKCSQRYCTRRHLENNISSFSKSLKKSNGIQFIQLMLRKVSHIFKMYF